MRKFLAGPLLSMTGRTDRQSARFGPPKIYTTHVYRAIADISHLAGIIERGDQPASDRSMRLRPSKDSGDSSRKDGVLRQIALFLRSATQAQWGMIRD